MCKGWHPRKRNQQTNTKMSKKLLKVDEYIKDPFPNPNPTSFHGKWTDWPDEHNQKSLNKKGVYVLRDKGAVPDGGKPFFGSRSS